MRVILFLFAVIAILAGGGIFGAAQSAIHEIEAFCLFLIASVLFAGACIVDAILSTRHKLEERLTERLDDMTAKLDQLATQLAKISVLLDPDEEKARQHAEHVARREAAQRAEAARLQRQKELQEAEEQRRKEAEEQERKAEKEREKEVKKLAKSEATLNCPSCNRPVTIRDLRTGAKHRCPHCNQVFEIS
jgi:flagellar biosynthesis GTPase FlhF